MVKRTRNKKLNVLFTEKERELIHETAKKQGLTVTDFILKLVKENFKK